MAKPVPSRVFLIALLFLSCLTHTLRAQPRIVILGSGIINAQGDNVEEFWNNFSTMTPSIGPIASFSLTDEDLFRVAAEVGHSNQRLWASVSGCSAVLADYSMKTFKRQDLFAIWAAQEGERRAFFDPKKAGWRKRPVSERVGCIVGSSMGGPIQGGEPKGRMLAGYQHCSTAAVNTALGIDDFSMSIAGACSSSTQAIVAGAITLLAGQSDVMYVGGTDAQITRDAMVSRNAILTRDNLSRPFSDTATGIVIGEGAGMLVASTEAHALGAGYHPLAVLEGFSSLVGGRDKDVPDPEWVKRLLRLSMEQAGLTPDDFNSENTVILAHGPGNQRGDLPELKGLALTFGDNVKNIPIISLAGWIGHPLGPAGVFRAVAAIEILNRGRVFGNLNLEKRHAGFENFNFPGGEGLTVPGVRHVIVLSLGLGGNYGALIFGKYEAQK